MRYVARPVEVEAVRWEGRYEEVPAEWRGTGLLECRDGRLTVKTLEGPVHVRPGDYLVRGTVAEFYPVRRPIFESKYEAVP